ncbi:sarcosine oxidase subunit gamma [Methylobacterium aquaticum]|uniref:sarcosine oxidase subunit gamma n=1 Tax=Methylobacterium aquaticum TaxID=270351 RepID=UPI003D1656F2
MADLAPRAAFAGLLHASAPPEGGIPGLVVSARPERQLAIAIARKGKRAELAQRLRQATGLALPEGPHRTTAGRMTALGTGPRSWLVMEEGGEPGLADRLAEALGPLAAVSDQSDGYAVLRLTGAHVRDVLAKGIALDLHPRAFGPGSAAVTNCAHLGVTLWQIDEAPTFELAVFRSYAGSLAHWLGESAAEFGLGVAAE